MSVKKSKNAIQKGYRAKRKLVQVVLLPEEHEYYYNYITSKKISSLSAFLRMAAQDYTLNYPAK